MSLTYTQLYNLVQAYLEDDGTTFTGNIDEMVRQAEDRIFYTVPELPDFFLTQTGTVTSSNRSLALPAGFYSVQTLSVSDGTSYAALLSKDASFIREAYPTGATGLPRFYAIDDDDNLLLAPTPNSGYAYELFYCGKPSSIVDASTSWLGNYGESVLLYGTLVECYTFLKGDPDLWQGYKMRYEEALGLLKKYASGVITRDDFRDIQMRTP